MSGSRTIAGRRGLYSLALLLLLVSGLACRGLATPTPSLDAHSDRKVYPTGIETVRLDNGIMAAFDHQGFYGLGFPEKWEVGAFHEDFIPTVEEYAQTNRAIKSLFNAIYQNDTSARIFAIDTSPEHLTQDSLATLHMGMFQGEPYAGRTLDELAAEYVRYLRSDSQIEIKQTLLGQSRYGISFVILVTESHPENGSPVYSAEALIQTDKTYIEMLYTTMDASINIPEELNSILQSFSTISE